VGLEVANPLWLFAFFPALLVLIVYWQEQKTARKSKKLTITILRSLVFTFLILALSGLHVLWSVKDVSTIFVADTSYSMNGHEEEVLSFINEAVTVKSEGDKTAVIAAGDEAVVERPLTNRELSIQEFQTTISSHYTNLASGLQLSSSLFSNEDRGRVVLLSDGNENIGDVKKQASYLNQQGYTVDVVPFSPLKSADVSLEALHVPRTMYTGENANLTIEMMSNIESNSRLILYEDNEAILNEEIEITKGKNSFTFPHLVTTSGFHTYKAEIVSKEDKVIENNVSYAFSDSRGLPSILIVEGNEGAAENLKRALDASFANADVIPPELLPSELSAYLNYHAIVFNNVSAPDITETQMILIEEAVKNFGVGFIMTGGNESYGLGGYFKTPIERLLPVHMDVKGKKELPSLGLMIVLDRSGSMAGHKIELAREAAARSVELLREKDTLGVIAFDSAPWQIVETGPIKDKQTVVDQIRSITEGGGTDIFPSLSMGYDQLSDLTLKRKHIILLTDGQSPTAPNYQGMIEQGKENGITLSTVAVGQGADVALLEEISGLGGGRFYDVHDASSIPTIFSRETALITRTYIEDEPFTPLLVNGYEWSHLFTSGVPQMNAYIASSPKGRAQQIFVSHKEDPVLVRWQYGLGKTIAWTSDLNEWAGNWPTWENWSPLWNEMVSWTFPQYNKQQYDVKETMNGNTMTVEISAADSSGGNVEAALLNSEGKPLNFSLHMKAPGEYEGTFTANEPGVYYLQLSEKEGENIAGTFKTGIVVPYSEEYKFQEQNLKLLEKIASAGGGKVIENPQEAFSKDLPKHYGKQDIFYLLLVFVLFLFLLDVAARRFEFSFAFLTAVKRAVEKKNEEKKTVIANKSTQLEHLKKAAGSHTESVKKTPTEHAFKREKSEIKAPERKAQQKEESKQKDITKKTQTQEERNERMTRLLNAKNRRK
jgi:Ca-activated chloride channel homolog